MFQVVKRVPIGASIWYYYILCVYMRVWRGWSRARLGRTTGTSATRQTQAAPARLLPPTKNKRKKIISNRGRRRDMDERDDARPQQPPRETAQWRTRVVLQDNNDDEDDYVGGAYVYRCPGALSRRRITSPVRLGAQSI